MYNYFEILCKKAQSILKEETFTEREAWSWLVSNAANGQLSRTIRAIASIWKWHKSKVERFINKIKASSLIETKVVSRKLVIKIIDYKNYSLYRSTGETTFKTNFSNIQGRQFQDKNRDSQPKNSSTLIKIAETTSRQIRDNQEDKNQDNIKTKANQAGANVFKGKEVVCSTKVRQAQDIIETETEILKEKKQKKTLSFKEKNIPYRDIKKESFQATVLSIDQIEASHAEEVGDNLSLTSTEIQQELEKFKSYWAATHRRKPRDGIAAFRSWLKKSIEFRGERKNYEQFSKNKTSQSGFERFLAGGSRAIAEIEWSGLDR